MNAQDAIPPRRVLLCDDALGFPELVASWLEDAPQLELAARVGSAGELLDRLEDVQPDIVLLDLMLPDGQTGPELVNDVRRRAPGTRVVLMSSLPATQLEAEAERAGADGFCPKAATADRLCGVLVGA